MSGMDLRRPLDATRRWLAGERGASEITAAIFVLPFLIALLFVLIELGFNLRYRGAVDNIVQDTTRSVAADGGNLYPPAFSGPANYNVGGNPGTGWAGVGRARLLDLCGDGDATKWQRRCSDLRNVRMTCTPQKPGPEPGTPVECTATFPYKPVAGFMSNNPVFSLGFSGIWNSPIEVTVRSVTSIGTGGA